MAAFDTGERVYPRYEGKQPIVPLGKDLVAALFNGLRAIYPIVTSPKEYAYFYELFASGRFITMDLAIVKKGERQ